jgi:hypothetical protein
LANRMEVLLVMRVPEKAKFLILHSQ